MLKELDIVKINKKINGLLPEGTKGLIHQIYVNEPSFYLIEFLDSQNDTICILDVSENDIEPV